MQTAACRGGQPIRVKTIWPGRTRWARLLSRSGLDRSAPILRSSSCSRMPCRPDGRRRNLTRGIDVGGLENVGNRWAARSRDRTLVASLTARRAIHGTLSKPDLDGGLPAGHDRNLPVGTAQALAGTIRVKRRRAAGGRPFLYQQHELKDAQLQPFSRQTPKVGSPNCLRSSAMRAVSLMRAVSSWLMSGVE